MAHSVDETGKLERSQLDGLATEAGGEPAADYDLRPTTELVRLMN